MIGESQGHQPGKREITIPESIAREVPPVAVVRIAVNLDRDRTFNQQVNAADCSDSCLWNHSEPCFGQGNARIRLRERPRPRVGVFTQPVTPTLLSMLELRKLGPGDDTACKGGVDEGQLRDWGGTERHEVKVREGEFVAVGAVSVQGHSCDWAGARFTDATRLRYPQMDGGRHCLERQSRPLAP